MFKIIGLPSGQIIEITSDVFYLLRSERLIFKIKRYKGIVLNEYCFDDNNLYTINRFIYF